MKINHLVKCNNIREEEYNELKPLLATLTTKTPDEAIELMFELFKTSQNFEGVVVSTYIAEISDKPKIGLILQRPKMKNIQLTV